MAGILIALIAQLTIGITLLVDKIFLKSPKEKRARTYVFWIGFLNVFSLAFTPFGFHFPSLAVVALALGTGIFFFLSLYLYYLVLDRSEASRSLIAMGGLSPLATAFVGYFLLATPLTIAEKIAFFFLIIGSFILALSEEGTLKTVLPFLLLASLSFGLTNVLEKIVFNETGFVTGFVLMKSGTLLASLTLLLFPRIRQEIMSRSKEAKPTHRFLYLANRLAAGSASALILYAIKLDHPALVDATTGFRYIVIFIGALLITSLAPRYLKETFRGRVLAAKLIATFFVLIGLLGLGLERYYESKPLPPTKTIAWGITFSPLMSDHLGLDWKETYGAIIHDIKPKTLRLIAYWDRIEPQKGKKDFSELDWQVTRAEEAHIPFVITIGQKVPRWPECHYPSWVDITQKDARETSLLDYMKSVVARYDHVPGLTYWQVENEPFLLFGNCPAIDSSFIDKEVALVKSFDPAHPVLITDGGEFGNWSQAAARADVFGTTLYRKVYNRIFGLITYPLTPEFYPLKADVTRWFTGKQNQKFIVIEVGLEPWTKKQIYEIPLKEQLSLFPLQDMKDTLVYARRAGFDTYYLWGAEWWYKTKQAGHPEYWNHVKGLLNGTISY